MTRKRQESSSAEALGLALLVLLVLFTVGALGATWRLGWRGLVMSLLAFGGLIFWSVQIDRAFDDQLPPMPESAYLTDLSEVELRRRLRQRTGYHPADRRRSADRREREYPGLTHTGHMPHRRTASVPRRFVDRQEQRGERRARYGE